MKVLNSRSSAAAMASMAMIFAAATAHADEPATRVAPPVSHTVEVQHIRNATVKVDYSGTTFLIDPMLSAKGGFPGFPGTYRSELRNPLADLPFSVEQVLESVEAIVVTHTHMDHWDEAAQKYIPKNMPPLKVVTRSGCFSPASYML